jgi:hypothetical protein
MHPVAKELSRRVTAHFGNIKVEKAVLEHGRPFTWVGRPKGYRQCAIKNCFANAGILASSERGIYVEGFAMKPGNVLFHHAWITLDGVHAIDVTLRACTPDVVYFGIPFSPKVLGSWIAKQGHWTLLNALNPIEKLEELLADACRNPPN